MRNATLTLMLGLLAFAVHADDALNSTPAQISSVFPIYALNPDRSINLGSAVLVAPGKLVTNCHVTRSAWHVAVVQGYKAWHVTSLVRDVEHDLCILSAPGVTGEIPRLAQSSELGVGQAVHAVGYLGRTKFVSNDGQVIALHRYNGGRVIQTSAAFSLGESGGGLFDDAGRLVGIIAFKAPVGGDFHFALPVEWINTLLAAADGNAPYPKETVKAFWEQPGPEQPSFMQAASLEAEKNWDQLLTFAQGWADAEPSNSGAWVAKTIALHHLNRDFEALATLQEAMQRDPSFRKDETLGVAFKN